MQANIPESRKERNRLIKQRAKNFYEWLIIREIEGAVDKRLKEKIIICLLALMWVVVGIYGQTPLCEVFGFPFALVTFFVGIWLI